MLLVGLGCGDHPPAEGALEVTIEAEPGARSLGVVLHVRAANGDGGVDSRPLAWVGQPLHVGVGPAAVGKEVLLLVQGFADAECHVPTTPEESSAEVAVHIVPGQVTRVTVVLRAGTSVDGGTLDAGAPDAGADAGADDAGLDAGSQSTRDSTRACWTLEPLTRAPPTPGRLPAPPPAALPGPPAWPRAATRPPAPTEWTTTAMARRTAPTPTARPRPATTATPALLARLCSGFACDGGVLTTCTQASNTCRAASGACVPATGACVFAPLAVTTACSDGLVCTTPDHCDGDGGCATTPVSCPAPPANGCFLPTAVCTEAAGGCAATVNLSGTCSDGDACTTGDHCLSDGGCAGSAVACTPAPACRTFSGQCSAAGACQYTVATDGATCPGGACSGGVCVPPSPFTYAPSNFLPASLPALDGGFNLVISCAATLDTGDAGVPVTGTLCGAPLPPWVSLAQSGGPEAVLFALDSLTINAGASLTVRGGRPAIFGVAGNVAIDGTFDVSGGATAPGPGGNGSCGTSAGGAGGGAANRNGGGGGGGFGTPGASGAPNFGDTSGVGAFGVALGTAELVPLRGGCNGGRGGDRTAGNGGAGGNAGGALQLSVAGTLSVSGTVSAAGQGGRPGAAGYGGGGGGASGGGLLLEAQSISVAASAHLTANGGAGAGPGESGSTGPAGQDGHLVDATRASGGISSWGSGGVGGARTLGPGAGVVGGGGGGGAVGRIRLNAQSACTVTAGAVFSPQPTSSLAGSSCTP